MGRSAVLGVLGLAVLVVTTQSARGADPEDVLKSNGLHRSGASYVLATEAEAQKKLNDAKALSRRLSNAAEQQHMLEQGARNNKALIQELTQERMLLNRQLSQVTNVADNNRLVGMIDEVTDRLNLLREAQNDPEGKKGLAAQVSELRGAFQQALIDLRQHVDETTRKYEALAQVDEVKGALTALNQKSKTRFALGPSRAFLANVKLLEKAEGSVLTEHVPLRDANGVHYVDVTFNGKVTRPMILDTGASHLSISARLAEEIGVRPGKDDPTVQSRIADGSVIESKLVKIASVRVGKFTAKDVPCEVSPAERGDVPPLLGGAFLRNFTYHIDSEAGKLTLTKVETAEAPKETPKGKGSRAPKGKRPAKAADTPDDSK